MPRRAPWGLRLVTAWSRPGDLLRWMLVGLGAALDLLWLPPGPLGLHLPALVLAADAPFLLLLWRDGGLRWKRWALLYGLVRFGVSLHWLTEVGLFQWAGAVLGLAPVYLVLGLGLRLGVKRRLPFVPLVGLAVVLEELLRTWWLGGMPWPQRSLAFVGWPSLRASASLAGAYGLSFLAGTTSALAAGLWGVARAAPDLRPRLAFTWFLSGWVPALWTLVLLVHGGSRLGHLRAALAEGTCVVTPRLLVVQGDIPQSLKHASGPDAANLIFNRHVALTRAGLAAAAKDRIRVLGVLWPETMIPWPFVTPDLARRFPEVWANEVVIAGRLRAMIPEGVEVPALFVGAIHHFPEQPGEQHAEVEDYGDHDSLFWIDPAALPSLGRPPPAPPAAGTALNPWERMRHDKVIRVPGGEYTPCSGWLPLLRVWRNALSEIPEIAAGDDEQPPFELWQWERVELGGQIESHPVRAGTVICFEIAFPERCRAWRRAGCQVLFNSANYGWFGPTAYRAQIRAVAALRAAELGQTVVMAGNTGPSACFDPVGAIYGEFHPQPLTDEGHLPELTSSAPGPSREGPGSDATTFQSGWVMEHLYADDALTPYARWGDLPWHALALAALAGALLRRARLPAG